MNIKEMRETTGMNRKQFAEYFGIPYRTVEDWEAGKRKAPDYVYNMINKIIILEGLQAKKEAD